MEFIEVPAFTSRVLRHLGEDRYAELQSHLSRHPTAGALIPGSKGLRKVRWAASGRGKRGGVRVIYYWLTADDQIMFLTVYGKGEKENLSAAELKQVVKLIEELK